jgi:hypothetical protein
MMGHAVFNGVAGTMDRSVGAAARLPARDCGDWAVQALARSESVSDLAVKHWVSRKFVYQRTHQARVALDHAFRTTTPDDDILFELVVTKAWLRQIIVALALICRGSCRGVMGFLRDLLGVSISVGGVHDILQSDADKAAVIYREQDQSAIRIGLHDELFQGTMPVLAGVCARSTYCYLLAAEQHRDADTWGVHLLDAPKQGLTPDYTIADAGQGLRAGQKAAWGETPCHCDVFHIQHQFETLANTLLRVAKGARGQSGVAPLHLFEDGDRPQPRCGLQPRHDLGVEEIGQLVRTAAATALPVVRWQPVTVLEAICSGRAD